MTEKTLRSIQDGRTLTPQTEEKLTELEARITAKLRSKSAWPLTGKNSRGLRAWELWQGLADYNDTNLPENLFPRTRHHLRTLASQEARMVEGFYERLPDVLAATCHLLTNPFARNLCSEDEVPTGPIIEDTRSLRTSEDFVAFWSQHPGFRRWHLHCVVSLLMSILAQIDVEVSPELKSNRSIAAPILPTMRDHRLYMPIRLLLERWASLLKLSFKQLSVQASGRLDAEDARRKLESWLNDEHLPSIDGIRTLLRAIVPNEQEREWAEKRYRIALLLTELFKAIERLLPQLGTEDRLAIFGTFHRHRCQAAVRADDSTPPSPPSKD